jgi:hypothetical protein
LPRDPGESRDVQRLAAGAGVDVRGAQRLGRHPASERIEIYV